MTKAARCFINMYFDLMEMERRKLEQRLLQTVRSEEAFLEAYAFSVAEAEVLSERFFKEVMIGNNQKGMLYWNDLIFKALEIDNLATFMPFEAQKP
jgi:hypothetical protein